MNKNMWIVAVVVVVVIAVLGGGYFVLNKNSESAKMAQEKAMMKDEGAPINPQDTSAKNSENAIVKDEKTSGNDSMMKGDAVMMAKSGDYQVADNGMALYTFDKDSKNVSNCTGQCLVNWPPYLVKGEVSASMPEHLGTFTKADGTKQYTWDGLPLYFYIGDKNVGDTTGDGVGGTWHLVK